MSIKLVEYHHWTGGANAIRKLPKIESPLSLPVRNIHISNAENKSKKNLDHQFQDKPLALLKRKNPHWEGFAKVVIENVGA